MKILSTIKRGWLSQRKVLKKVGESEDELHVFLLEKKKKNCSKFLNFSMIKNACLAVFEHTHPLICPNVKEAFLIRSEKMIGLENNSCYQDRILKTDVWQNFHHYATLLLKTI